MILIRKIFTSLRLFIELVQFPFILLIALISRLAPRPIDIGLGPLPLINNVHHKKALILKGFSAETFVDQLWFITSEFDHIFIWKSNFYRRIVRECHFIFLFSIVRYRCLYMYFNGGPLSGTIFLWRFEPQIYRIAGIKTVLMPYGADVQDLMLTKNLFFRHTMSLDYPSQRLLKESISKKINLWICHADHIISGCDWVEYMHFWHTLMISHFSIDLEIWQPTNKKKEPRDLKRPFKVLHAPNHRAIKGTDFFIKAVNELQKEGVSIELILIEKLPNEQMKKIIDSVDLVADQLIVGWYAMFAIESMAMGKPTLCYLRNDLEELYIKAGLIKKNEIPLIKCDVNNIKSTLLMLIKNPKKLDKAAKLGPIYVKRHHSLEAVGKVFNSINKSIGILPNNVMKKPF